MQIDRASVAGARLRSALAQLSQLGLLWQLQAQPSHWFGSSVQAQRLSSPLATSSSPEKENIISIQVYDACCDPKV